MARKTNYAGYLAIARIEQLLDDQVFDGDGSAVNDVAAFLVSRAVSTTFLPRRRQIQITFDLPTDGDDDAPDA